MTFDDAMKSVAHGLTVTTPGAPVHLRLSSGTTITVLEDGVRTVVRSRELVLYDFREGREYRERPTFSRDDMASLSWELVR